MGLEHSVQKQVRALQVCIAFLTIAVIVPTATAFNGSEQHFVVRKLTKIVSEICCLQDARRSFPSLNLRWRELRGGNYSTHQQDGNERSAPHHPTIKPRSSPSCVTKPICSNDLLRPLYQSIHRPLTRTA